MPRDDDKREQVRLARIREDAHAPETAVARDLHAMISAAQSPEERKAVEAAAADLRKRAGFQ
jgi:hypothetical protein